MAIETPVTVAAEGPVQARATNVRYTVLLWACSLAMLTYLDRVAIKEFERPISGDLGFTTRQMGLVFSAFALSYSLFEIPSGWLGDLFGSRLVLSRIVLCWSLFTALTGCVWAFELDSGYTLGEVPLVVNSLVLMVLVRFLFGAGEAGAFPNLSAALRRWFPYAWRGKAQGCLWLSGRWGGALSPWVAGLFALAAGWRGAFMLLGIVGIVWVTAFVMLFRNSPAEHPGVNAAEKALIEQGRPELAKPPPLSWSTMLSSPTLWLIALMYFCSNAGWCFFITWDKRYYETVLGMEEGLGLKIASTLPLFFGGVACVVGGLFTDRLVHLLGRRWGRTLQASIAYFMGGCFFMAALYAESAWVAVACLTLASFSKDFAMAVSWATCLDIGHRYSGTVSAFMNTVGNLGTVVAPNLVAYLASRGESQGGWHWALIVSSVALFCASACWPFINPRRVIVYDRPLVDA